MKLPLVNLAVLSATCLALNAIIAAGPASAATITVNDANCTAASTTGVAISAAQGDTVRIVGNFTGCEDLYVSKSLVASAASVTITETGGNVISVDAGANWVFAGAAGITNITILLASVDGAGTVKLDSGPPTPLLTTWNVTISGSGSSTSDTSSSVEFAPTPVLETLSLSVTASGASCTGGNPTGYSGTWMALPKADECTQSGPNAKPGAKLLGWSPNANFPADVAQNQIAKGWGVYDGPINGVRMIFIPAGMSTYVTGSNTLYPVWSA